MTEIFDVLFLSYRKGESVCERRISRGRRLDSVNVCEDEKDIFLSEFSVSFYFWGAIFFGCSPRQEKRVYVHFIDDHGTYDSSLPYSQFYSPKRKHISSISLIFVFVCSFFFRLRHQLCQNQSHVVLIMKHGFVTFEAIPSS